MHKLKPANKAKPLEQLPMIITRHDRSNCTNVFIPAPLPYAGLTAVILATVLMSASARYAQAGSCVDSKCHTMPSNETVHENGEGYEGSVDETIRDEQVNITVISLQNLTITVINQRYLNGPPSLDVRALPSLPLVSFPRYCHPRCCQVCREQLRRYSIALSYPLSNGYGERAVEKLCLSLTGASIVTIG
ncbi:hypothetical protein RB195_024350 [Necator americanus]|uniref:Uncharacterized protein n=1 Tax=Necator americanus TaxID=51031 RepID=A0ABR1EQ21_NECAM